MKRMDQDKKVNEISEESMVESFKNSETELFKNAGWKKKNETDSVSTISVNGCKFNTRFNPTLYSGLRACTHGNSKQHVHVSINDDDIKMLLNRAEEEIIQERVNKTEQDKHAKTMVQAQYEVLNCIGIYIYERIHKIWYSWQGYTRTAPLLCAMTLEAMKMNYERLLEEKQGGAEEVYERLLAELEVGEKKITKSSKKREKKKKKEKIKVE